MIRIILFLVISCLSLRAFGQKSADDIIRKYNAFRKEYPGVRIGLVFNQYRFAPGDTVWFKAYFLNADNSPVKGRQLLDLNVVGPDSSILQHFLFSVTDGIGFNQFIFPETTAPGIYNVTAYSSWMMNFSPPNVFSESIDVVGEKEIVPDEQPVVKKDFSLTLLPGPEGSLSFSVNDGSMLRYQDLFMVATRADKIMFIKPFRVGLKTREVMSFDRSPGPVNLAVIDKAGRIVTTMAANLDDIDGAPPVKVNMEVSDGVLKTRKKTKLTIGLTGNNDQPLAGEFSVSVLSTRHAADTGFSSDLIPEIPSGEPWRQIFSGRTGEPHFGFTTNLYRSGTAYYSDEITPVPAGTTIVFYLQNNDIILQATTAQDGRFTLPLRDINKGDEMIALAEKNGDPIPGLMVKWDQNSTPLPVPPTTHEGEKEDTFGLFASTKKLIDRAFMFYGSEESERISVVPTAESFLEERIGAADISVDVQKYVTFQTMRELIREIVPSLQARTVKGVQTVLVTLREPMPVAKTTPVFIIDGIVTTDSKSFMAMKPSDVATIRVVTNPAKLLPLGLIGKNGIVIVETIKGNARPSHQMWQIVEGINPAMTFRLRSHQEVDLHKPDIRSTIHWVPTVTTDAGGKAEVEFFHSDDTGVISVVVKGRTKDGRAFEATRSFRAILK